MKRSHHLRSSCIQISYFPLEIVDQLKGWKLHEKMLNSPTSIRLRHWTFFLNHLRVDIASQIYKKLNNTKKFILKLTKFFKSLLFSLKFKTPRFKLDLLLTFQHLLKFFDRPLYVFIDILAERFDKKQQEVKTILIDLLDIDLKLTLKTLPQLFLHKLQLIKPSAGQTAQTVKNSVATSWFNLKSDLFGQ